MKCLTMLLVAGILWVPVAGWCTVPPDATWILVRSASGVGMYQKGSDIVQVVRLDQGARIGFYQVQDIYNASYFQRLEILQAWTNFTQQQPLSFSFCNGQFFSTSEQPTTRLSFSLRANNEFLTSGFDMGTYLGQKMAWKVFGADCRLEETDDDPLQLLNSSAPNAMVGLEGFANKNPTAAIGRTFVGANDPEPNGRFKTVLIFNSSSSTQQHAVDVLTAFGAGPVMMLDGGGSTQLRVHGETLISGDGRTLPQFIGVLAADNTPPSTPTNLSVNPTGCSATNSFTFSWSPSTDTGGSGLAGYRWQINGTDNPTPTPATQTSVATTAPYSGNHTFYVWAYDNAGNESGKPSIGFCYQPPTGPCPGREIPHLPCVGPSTCYPAMAANLQTLPELTVAQWQTAGQPVREMLKPGETYSLGFEYRSTANTEMKLGLGSLNPSSDLGVVINQTNLPAGNGDWRPFWSALFSVTAEQLQRFSSLRFIEPITSDGLRIRNVRILGPQ